MNYLLDTNAWLRAVGRLHELNDQSQAILGDPANAPFGLSAISVFEVCTKFRTKPTQLGITLPIQQWLEVALKPGFIHVIPLDAEIGRLANELPEPFHKDPGDRIVVATARRENLRLLTSDGLIIHYPHVQAIDTNR